MAVLADEFLRSITIGYADMVSLALGLANLTCSITLSCLGGAVYGFYNCALWTGGKLGMQMFVAPISNDLSTSDLGFELNRSSFVSILYAFIAVDAV